MSKRSTTYYACIVLSIFVTLHSFKNGEHCNKPTRDPCTEPNLVGGSQAANKREVFHSLKQGSLINK